MEGNNNLNIINDQGLISSSGISYRGDVTIKLMKNGREIRRINRHNAGCASLFTFLVNCICGTFDGNDKPRFLMGYYNSGDPSESYLGEQALYSTIPASSVEPTNTSTTHKAVLKFVIPSSSVQTIVTDITPLNVLALYSANNQQYATSGSDSSAYIKLSDSEAIKRSDLGTGVSIVVLWNMTVENKTSST